MSVLLIFSILSVVPSRCKSCAKFGRKLDKLAAEHADWVSKNHHDTVVKPGDLRIVNVEYGAARELCKNLGISRLPTVHMYMGGEKVQDFSCPPSKFDRVKDLVKAYTKKQKAAAAAAAPPTTAASSEADFEQVLDQGRSLVQKHLEVEAEPKRRFWNRFRAGKRG